MEITIRNGKNILTIRKSNWVFFCIMQTNKHYLFNFEVNIKLIILTIIIRLLNVEEILKFLYHFLWTIYFSLSFA